MHLHENILLLQNFAQYPLLHVTYSGTTFEVALSNGSEGDV